MVAVSTPAWSSLTAAVCRRTCAVICFCVSEAQVRLAARAGLHRLVPCHGGIVRDDAPGVLRRVAEQL